EGMARGHDLHPLQRKFLEHAALQCGFCTPGLLIAAKALLDRNPDPTETEARYWLAGNLCRCTGYDKVIRAGLDAAAEMRGASGAALRWHCCCQIHLSERGAPVPPEPGCRDGLAYWSSVPYMRRDPRQRDSFDQIPGRGRLIRSYAMAVRSVTKGILKSPEP